MKNLILFFVLISLKVFATEQIPDILIYNGKKYEWKSSFNPGRDYIKTFSFKVPEDAIETTANYGFYTFTYTIENDSLFLTDITILVKKERGLDSRSVFKDFFKDKEKIIMEYSKIQTFPYGKQIEVTKSNWTDIHFAKYLVFEFKNGKVEKKYDLNYERFLKLKENLFLKFKQTEEYSKSKVTEIENLESFNEVRPEKFSMESYLEFKILGLIKTLKE